MYEPVELGAVAEQVYNPPDTVVTVTMPKFHPKTHTIGFPTKPAPFAVNVPETVNDAPCTGFAGDAEAVSEVETGLDKDPVLRCKVIEEGGPGPVKVTVVGLLEPEHDNPPVQLQLEIV